MADNTKISYCDATWTAVAGCSRVSAGCDHCWAVRMAHRLGAPGSPGYETYQGLAIARPRSEGGPEWSGAVRINRAALPLPHLWKRSNKIVLVSPMGDIFHETLTWGEILWVFKVAAENPWHTFLFLTKRPARALEFTKRWADLSGEDLSAFRNARGPDETAAAHPSPRGQMFVEMLRAWAPPSEGWSHPLFDWMEGMQKWPEVFHHILIGCSIETEGRAQERFAAMYEIAARGWRTWLSYEPALGPIDWPRWDFVEFIAAGCETGPGAREADPDWFRACRNHCTAHSIAFHIKKVNRFSRKLDRFEHLARPGRFPRNKGMTDAAD